MAKIHQGHIDRYRKWHWGEPAHVVYAWPDADYPEHMIEIGRLCELHFSRTGKEADIEKLALAEPYVNQSFVVFDPAHKYQRIYYATPEPVRREVRRAFWNPRGQTWNLRDLAVAVGGKHGTRDYPAIRVQVVGALFDVVYLTKKKGDGLSQYIHRHGEVTHVQPALAVDADGRFWLAGSNYTCPTPGITD